MKFARFLTLGRYLLILSSCAAATTIQANAASYTWKGGDGAWNTTDNFWNNSSVAWPAAATDAEAIFEGTAGTVTLASEISANRLTFNVNGYTVAGNKLTLNGNAPAISVAGASNKATISSMLAGSNGFTKTGAGTLVLSGADTGETATLSGTLTIAEGKVQFNAKKLFFGATNTITLNANTTLEFILNDLYSNNAPKIIINEGATVTNSGSAGFNNLAGGGIVLNGGTLTSTVAHANYGAWTLGSLVEVTGNATSTIANTVRIASATTGIDSTTFRVSNGTADVDLDVTAKISDTRQSASALKASKLVKEGDGTMRLTNTGNDYSGGTDITGGSLMIGDGGATGSIGKGKITISGTGRLVFNRNDAAFAIGSAIGAIEGNGTIEQFGTGTTTLSQANAGFNGTVVVSNGTIKAGAANAFGTGSSTVNGGTLDLGGFDDTTAIKVNGGSLANAGAKVSGSVVIDQSVVFNSNLGGLQGSKLTGVKTGVNKTSDTASSISGINGNVSLTSTATLGLSTAMYGADDTGTGAAALNLTSGTLTLSDLSLEISDALAAQIAQDISNYVSNIYLHISNVATSISGTVSFASPYHTFNDLTKAASSTSNGWLRFDLSSGGPVPLIINEGQTFLVSSYDQYGFDQYTSVVNNGTLKLTLPDATGNSGLTILALEGMLTSAVIDTTESTEGSRIIFKNGEHRDGLYQGSIIGHSQIVLNGANDYHLTINGQIQGSQLDIKTGKLTSNGYLDIAGNANVLAGATLELNGGGHASIIGGTLDLGGSLNMGNNAVLSVQSLTGNGTLAMNKATLNIGTASVLNATINGEGTVHVSNGNLTLGATQGGMGSQTLLDLGTNAGFIVSAANDERNIIGGLSGDGALTLDGGTLQIKGQGGSFSGQLLQNGTINYSGSGTQQFNGKGGSGVNLVQSGSGTTVLNSGNAGGPVSYGNVTASDGALSLTSDMESQSLAIGSGATLKLGNMDPAHQTVNTVTTGTLALAAGGSMIANVDIAAISAGKALITATGPVTQASGGAFNITLNALGDVIDWTAPGLEINVISGNGTFTADAFNIMMGETLSILGYEANPIYSSQGVKIGLSSTGVNGFARFANSANTSAAAQMLWDSRLTATKGSMLSDILNSVVANASSPGAVNESLASLSGSSITSLLSSTRDDLVQQVDWIRNRLVHAGIMPGYQYEDLPYFNAWIQGNGAWNQLKRSGDKAGYDLDTWGGTLGVDANVTSRLTVGLAFTANHNKIKTKSYDYADGDNDAYYINLYARLRSKAWAHSLILTGAWNDMNLSRTVNVAGMAPFTSKGDTDGRSYGVFYEGTYDITINEEKTAVIQPLVNASLYRSQRGGYTETGAGNASLGVNEASATYGTAGIGARLLGVIGSNVLGREAIGEFRVQGVQDYGSRTDSAIVHFTGTPGSSARVYGARVGRTGIQAGAGIVLPVAAQGSVFANADVDFRSRGTSVSGNIGYRYTF